MREDEYILVCERHKLEIAELKSIISQKEDYIQFLKDDNEELRKALKEKQYEVRNFIKE